MTRSEQPEAVAEWLDEIRRENGDGEAALAERIVTWSREHGMRDNFTNRHPNAGVSYWPVLLGVEWEPAPFGLSSVGTDVHLSGETLFKHKPFNMDVNRTKLVNRVIAIPGAIETPQNIYPRVPLALFAQQDVWDGFFGTMEWALGLIKRLG